MSSGADKEQDNRNVEEFNKFLANNEELLMDKYREYFIKDSLKITAKTPSVESVVKYITDVFSFDKNSVRDAEMLLKIESSLKDSYHQFLKDHRDIKLFNFQVATQLLKFCIVNNQLFAVQYEISNPQPDKPPSQAAPGSKG